MPQQFIEGFWGRHFKPAPLREWIWLNHVHATNRTCQRALQLNEKIITGLKQNIDRFIHILHSQTSTAQTYNAAGKTENFLSRRALTQA